MSRFLSVLACLALAVLISACGGSASQSVRSGIVGVALAGPTCPVESLASPCPERALRATLAVYGASNQFVTRFSTSPQGRFRVRLAPGSYRLRAQGAFAYPRLVAPLSVKVRPGEFTRLTLQFDTGIR